MWAAGALAAEVCLEDSNIDSLDIVYKPDNGLPSVASTKSFLRMICNDQYYLDQNELKAWPNDVLARVSVPHRNQVMHALPWGGACEPVWFQHDERVRNFEIDKETGREQDNRTDYDGFGRRCTNVPENHFNKRNWRRQ